MKKVWPMLWRTSKPEPLGMRGERLAARFLRWRGYRLVARNLKLGKNEIDLLVRKGDTLAFVEVKTRLRADSTDPHDSVGPEKQRHIKAAAQRYLSEAREQGTYYRFDVVSVVLPERGKAQITHYPDAFR